MKEKNKNNVHPEEVKKIISIFEKSGIASLKEFEVKLDDNASDIDVLGIYGNIIILVECVGEKKFGEKIKKAASDQKSFIKNFNDIVSQIKSLNGKFYKNNKKGLNSDKKKFYKIIVSLKKETQKNIDKKHIRMCGNNNQFIWSKEEVLYYKKISECAYDHCRYEIFQFLNVRPGDVEKEEIFKLPHYLAYGRKYKRGLYLLNIEIPVSDLLKCSSVRRLQNVNAEGAYQRLLNKTKLKKMREYLLDEGILKYPNNIICSLTTKCTVSPISDHLKKLELKNQMTAKEDSIKKYMEDKLFIVERPKNYDVFEIIDGQHRLFSFAQDRYAEYRRGGKNKKLEKDDKKIGNLAKKEKLMVTAIYSQNPQEWGEPGKLFLFINSKQTRIKSEHMIDLKSKYYPKIPISKANDLVKELNKKGVLKNKIKVKFWQNKRIKRTSLIRYSGIKKIFEENKKMHKIFESAYKKQNKIKNFSDFCLILINNYLRCVLDIVKDKRGNKKYEKILEDLTLDKYYLLSAVFIAALIRLMKHFLSEKNYLKISDKIKDKIIVKDKKNEKIKTRKKLIKRNIENKGIQKIFKKELEIIVKTRNFTKEEFDKTEGWTFNKWAKIESDLFYEIRKVHKNFGDEDLIYWKYKKDGTKS